MTLLYIGLIISVLILLGVGLFVLALASASKDDDLPGTFDD